MSARKRGIRRWLKSTSRRTFVLYPVLVIAVELLLNRGVLSVWPWGTVFLLWGYLQYRLIGNYRLVRAGGGPGLDTPPERIIDTGPYRYTRNPMYLGHLIFMIGLALTFRSLFAWALLAFHLFWFHRRALKDEAQLEARFGEPYRAYKQRVKRWIPWLF